MDSKQQTQSQSSSAPWDPQANALQSAFTNAQTAYGSASAAKPPSDFTAGMTPEQLSNYNSMLGYGAGNLGSAADVSGVGLENLYAGQGSSAGALSTLGSFNPSATNNIGTAVNGAQQFANGLDINGAVANSMLPAMQQLRDVTLPGMESGAAGSGNINSSRTGLAEGVAERGLAEQASGLASSMFNNAYNTGAGIAANQAGLNNAQTLQGATAQGTLAGSLGSLGSSQVGQGIGDAGNLFTMAAQGGAGNQQASQQDLTNQLQQYQAHVQSPYDALNGLMNIIGSRNWGSNTQGTSNTTTTPSMLQTIGGIMSIF